MYTLSTSSKEVYDTLHQDLQKIVDLALQLSPVDFKLTEGYRSQEEQFELYKRGRQLVGDQWVITDKNKVVTYIDGKSVKSKHNYNPSLAFDFAAYVPGHPEYIYDEVHMISIGSVMMACANLLYQKGEITHKVRWGANWDNDGELIYDHSFVDIPHIELISDEK